MSSNEFPTGPRPGDRDTTFLEDPVVDHLLRAVVTLTMEVSVSRERIATLEGELAKQGVLSGSAIDTAMPDAEEQKRRAAARAKLIQDVLGPLVAKLSRPE